MPKCLAATVAVGSVCTPVHAALPVLGGPTYDPTTRTGLQVGPGPFYFKTPVVAGEGYAVASGSLSVGGVDRGGRAVRFDANGSTVYGTPGTSAAGYNDAGIAPQNKTPVVVGSANRYVNGVDQGVRGVVWDAAGTPTPLAYGGPAGADYGVVVDDRGRGGAIAGTLVQAVYVNGVRQPGWQAAGAVRWDSATSAMTPLGGLTPGTTGAYCVGVSAAGVAFGVAYRNDDAYKARRIVRWDPGRTTPVQLDLLGTPATGDYFDNSNRNRAEDVSEGGVVVGSFSDLRPGVFDGQVATRWRADGSIEALDGLTTGPNAFASAQAVNERGDAVGFARDASVAGGYAQNLRPMRWDAGQTAGVRLGLLPGTVYGAFAQDINDNGLAVGVQLASANLPGTAVLWRANGTAVDLNALIDPASGWTLISASSITDSGWVAGGGLFDPDGTGPQAAYYRGYLIQVPEPAAVCGLGVAAGLLVRRRRRAVTRTT